MNGANGQEEMNASSEVVPYLRQEPTAQPLLIHVFPSPCETRKSTQIVCEQTFNNLSASRTVLHLLISAGGSLWDSSGSLGYAMSLSSGVRSIGRNVLA